MKINWIDLDVSNRTEYKMWNSENDNILAYLCCLVCTVLIKMKLKPNAWFISQLFFYLLLT